MNGLTRLRLEASTACQLKCPACETAQGITQKKLGTGFLDLDKFKSIVDNHSSIYRIELSNWGEIFLNPALPQIMEYAYSKNVSLSATNGANLNTVKESALESLVKFKFRHITCSIDGASQETYSLYRRGGNFDRVIQNIQLINDYKRKHQSLLPLLDWQFVVFGHNEHEITAAKTMAAKLNMRFRPKLSWDSGFSPIQNSDAVRKATGIAASSREEYLKNQDKEYLRPCAQMWTNPQINWDGKILGCCYNYWSDFGNLFNVSDLKNSFERLQYAKKMLLGQAPPREDMPCSNCGYYERMQERNDYVSDLERLSSKKERFLALLGRSGVWLVNHSKVAERLYAQHFGHLI